MENDKLKLKVEEYDRVKKEAKEMLDNDMLATAWYLVGKLQELKLQILSLKEIDKKCQD